LLLVIETKDVGRTIQDGESRYYKTADRAAGNKTKTLAKQYYGHAIGHRSPNSKSLETKMPGANLDINGAEFT